MISHGQKILVIIERVDSYYQSVEKVKESNSRKNWQKYCQKDMISGVSLSTCISTFYILNMSNCSEVAEEHRKVALITGITGQDGSYLAELLLAKVCLILRI